MKHVALIALIIGCASATGPVTVRMARPGDDLSRPPAAVRRVCALDGAPAPDQYDAIVAFVRTHIAMYKDAVAYLVAPGTTGPIGRQQGGVIVVEPRTGIGSLELRFTLGERGGWGTRYCLHVVESGGARVVVIDQLSRWIN